MKLTAIVAMTPERVIGRDNDLPWHFPEDLKFFKRTTSGHPILMGRKTYDSIGRPLPKRQNIVLTRDESWSAEGVDVIHSPSDLASLPLQDEEVFIIGGAEIYALFLPQLDELLLTWIYQSHEGDAYFPDFADYFADYEVIEKQDEFEWRRYRKSTV